MKFKKGDVVCRVSNNKVHYINKVLDVTESTYYILELWSYGARTMENFNLKLESMDRDGRLITDDEKISLL